MTTRYQEYKAEWKVIRAMPPDLQDKLIAQLHGAAAALSIISDARKATEHANKRGQGQGERKEA